MRTLSDVYEAYRTDPAFDRLRTPGIVLVPGEGSSRPNVFIVGEAPGAAENTERRPFVGASGGVLRSLIRDVAELDPADWFLTNTVKYRPPGNRTPYEDEIAASQRYLRAEYAAVGSPPVIVAVGGTARAALATHLNHTGRFGGILSVAGKPSPIPNTRNKWIWPMVHPSYALRNAAFRPTMEEHWEEFGRWYRKGDWRP